MKKLKVLFPRVEAGFGHIMTCNAVEEIFTKKYGKYFEVLNFDFYKSCPDKTVQKYGKVLMDQVELYTSHPAIGHLITGSCEFFGTTFSSWFGLHFPRPWQVKKAIKYLESLKPDVIYSTHWATNYYAEHMKENKPFTIMYCPDAYLNKMFKYKADLTLCSMENGLEEAKKDKHFDSSNLKLVPFCIRNSAFDLKDTKIQSRKKLGISNRFTVVLTEGGYGNGKMPKIIKRLLKLDLPINIVAICGKNAKLAEKMKTYEVGKNTSFVPLGFVKNIFEYINSADLFCGKAGNMIAEPTFFGVPSIVSGLSTGIENHIADYYADYAKCAIIETNYKKATDLIVYYFNNPDKLNVLKENAIKHHTHFGAEGAADLIFKEICKRFNLEVKL